MSTPTPPLPPGTTGDPAGPGRAGAQAQAGPGRAGAQSPPLASGALIVPARRLEPSPGADRRLRRLTTVLGALLVMLVVLALAGFSLSTWLAGRGFSPVPAITTLGEATSLSLSSDVGDVRVLPSSEVEELTLALVAPGVTVLPAGDAQEEARITRTTTAGRTTVEVEQPSRSVGAPWADGPRDVLLLVPTGLELALSVHTEVGDVMVDGELTSLEVHADVGDLQLGPVSAAGGVRAHTGTGNISLELGSPAPTDVVLRTAVGEIDVMLPTDAGGQVTATSDLGDVEISVPGTARWELRTDAGAGEVSTAPGLAARGDDGVGTLTVSSGLGDIRLTR